ncbi:hypothetical protein DFR75_101235 [Nocardia ignorata]|uniref:Uncharacterized protein n=1 Tax=Nocardia ignorata TaxID=145285 RepID=A0A4R6PSG5_NOCIG|nr:hypothetical protein DFR75_101235 [Nocardia ignorata]
MPGLFACGAGHNDPYMYMPVYTAVSMSSYPLAP